MSAQVIPFRQPSPNPRDITSARAELVEKQRRLRVEIFEAERALEATEAELWLLDWGFGTEVTGG